MHPDGPEPLDGGDENENTTDRIVQAVRFYRGLGLFQTYGTVADSDLTDEMYDNLEAYSDESDGSLDLVLLAQERTRAWLSPLQIGAMEGSNIYVWALECWSNISQGAFLPENITEDWAEPGKVTIRFLLNGQQQTVIAEGWRDLDLGVVGQINYLIDSTPYRFFYSAWSLEQVDAFVPASVVTSGSGFVRSDLSLPRCWRVAGPDAVQKYARASKVSLFLFESHTTALKRS